METRSSNLEVPNSNQNFKPGDSQLEPFPNGIPGIPSPSPVAHPAGEVQAGVLEVPLEVGQQEVSAALGADVGRAAAVHALVRPEAAAVGQDHGARRAHLGEKMGLGQGIWGIWGL